MQHLLLIFFCLLSALTGGGNKTYDVFRAESAGASIEADTPHDSAERPSHSLACLSVSSGLGCFGGGSNVVSSIHPNGSGHRVHIATAASGLVVNDTFQTVLLRIISGTRSSGRYLLSICHLQI